MDYDELLRLKKEVDELSLYYRVLKEKAKELDEKFYSNNLLADEHKDDIDELVTEESINKKIREGRTNYNIGKILGYSIRYMGAVMANAIFDLPKGAFTAFIFINLSYYCIVIFGYERIMRRKLEKKAEEHQVDFEELAKEKKEVDQRLEYVQKRYCELSSKYENMVGKLEEDEYLEYLEYISEYLQYMLENSKELLQEVSDNYLLPDYDMEMDSSIDSEENDESHKYRLN